MTELTNFMTYPTKKFWELVRTTGEPAKQTFLELWKKSEEKVLTPDEARECLNSLFIYTHKRIREKSTVLARYYPTKQFSKNKLTKVDNLWWVDHFTAGISAWSTLSWFSARRNKKGKLNGASTHFIQGFHGDPFYIIPLVHKAWHEPRRQDSIGIEHVNPGPLTSKNQIWHYHAGELPLSLVQELPPVLLAKPYRGAKVMLPYTKDQIINNVKLKRIVLAALEEGRLIPERMSQHTDWRTGKSDMGPLWPFDECNAAAFSTEPIYELDFIQRYDDFLDNQEIQYTEVDEEPGDPEQNPSYGRNTPTHPDDPDPESSEMLTISELQKRLIIHGHVVEVDGIYGRKTYEAVKQFQLEWNKKHPQDTLKVDGLAGPVTCTKLRSN